MKLITRNIYFLLLFMLVVLTACVDELVYNVDQDIPEGYSRINVEVGYQAFTSALDTRSAGDALKAIDKMYVVVYSEDGTHISMQKIEDFTTGQLENRPDYESEEQTGHASFSLTLPNGKYKIYAIANVDLENHLGDREYFTEKELQNVCIYWDKENIRNNAEMFGWFVNGDKTAVRNKKAFQAQTVIINGNSTSLHAWLRRCASKITLAYDGTNLDEGVSIYLMGASVKDIPRVCALGANNKISHTDSIIKDGERIIYYNGTVDPYTSLGQFINSLSTAEARVVKGRKWPVDASGNPDHSEYAEALYFYENMQGEGRDKRQKDENNDGIVDNNDIVKDDKPFGTYIEVEAIYRIDNTENGVVKPETGIIKYRFMLGKNITTNYDAERNHHYKLTLKFNGSAKDIDWHIDYEDQVLEVAYPAIFDYRGKVFSPDTSKPNYGHEFVDENSVTVVSYMDNHMDKLEKFEILYDEQGNGNFTSTRPSWMKEPVIKETGIPYEKNVVFTVQSIEPTDINIDSYLSNATSKSNSASMPYNLSNPSQGAVNPAAATAYNTANCYIVEAPGYYLIPLVYGNAIKNGGTNSTAYKPGGTGLGTFVNHLGKEISNPYIANNGISLADAKATLVWQDQNGMIDYSVWDAESQVEFVPTAFGGKGGIRFHIDKSNIKQGNAVIALVDKSTQGENAALEAYKSANVIWSWHIWVTALECFKEDKTIQVTSGVNDFSSPTGKRMYDFLAMNLGWCSEGGDIIKYYPGRTCSVKFKSGEKEQIRQIVQKSHISFTAGNSPYYQWGRKDPFIGANGHMVNKVRYLSINWGIPNNPWAITGDFASDSGRETTTAKDEDGNHTLLAKLIKFPYLWHNPPRKSPGLYGNPYRSVNEIYNNLWGEQTSSMVENVKTVYDPSPVGYKVPHYAAFTGFTVTHNNTNTEDYWFNAQYRNIAGYDEGTQTCGIYSDNLYEFYTNKDKYQSIIFPILGYRDWDDWANAYRYGEIGYCWTAVTSTPEDFLSYRDMDWVFNFEFSHRDTSGLSYIRPKNEFYACDGFPIRPCKE